MTIEELQAEVARLSGELETVNSNNTKLVREKREALSRAEKAEQDAEEAAENAKAETGTELEKAERLIKKLEKELETAKNAKEAAETDLRTIRVDNEISKALDEGNVLPHMKPVLASHYKLMAKYEDGQGNIEGNPIADYIKTHLASDEGANYRKASENTGGNANDSTKTVTMQKLSKRPETQAEWDYLDSLPDAERNALCDAIGEPSLKV